MGRYVRYNGTDVYVSNDTEWAKQQLSSQGYTPEEVNAIIGHKEQMAPAREGKSQYVTSDVVDAQGNKVILVNSQEQFRKAQQDLFAQGYNPVGTASANNAVAAAQGQVKQDIKQKTQQNAYVLDLQKQLKIEIPQEIAAKRVRDNTPMFTNTKSMMSIGNTKPNRNPFYAPPKPVSLNFQGTTVPAGHELKMFDAPSQSVEMIWTPESKINMKIDMMADEVMSNKYNTQKSFGSNLLSNFKITGEAGVVISARALQTGYGSLKGLITEPWQVVNPNTYIQGVNQLGQEAKNQPLFFVGDIAGIYGSGKLVSSGLGKGYSTWSKYRTTDLSGQAFMTTTPTVKVEEFSNLEKTNLPKTGRVNYDPLTGGNDLAVLGQKASKGSPLISKQKITTITEIPKSVNFNLKGLKQGKTFEMTGTQLEAKNPFSDIDFKGKIGTKDFFGSIKGGKTSPRIMEVTYKGLLKDKTVKELFPTAEPISRDVFKSKGGSEITKYSGSFRQNEQINTKISLGKDYLKLNRVQTSRESIVDVSQLNTKSKFQTQPVVIKNTDLIRGYDMQLRKINSVSIKESKIQFADFFKSPQDVTNLNRKSDYTFDKNPFTIYEEKTIRGGNLVGQVKKGMSARSSYNYKIENDFKPQMFKSKRGQKSQFDFGQTKQGTDEFMSTTKNPLTGTEKLISGSYEQLFRINEKILNSEPKVKFIPLTNIKTNNLFKSISRTNTMSGLDLKSNSRSITKPLSETIPISKLKTDLNLNSITQSELKTMSQLKTESKTMTVSKTAINTPRWVTSMKVMPITIETPLPKLQFPSFFSNGMGKKGDNLFGKLSFKQKRAYNPSIYANMFNIKGKRTKADTLGLGIQPL